MRKEGIWVPWDTKNTELPKYAVYAKTTYWSNRFYIMRANIWDEGNYKGSIVGKYSVKKRVASVGWNKEIYTDQIEVKF